MNTFKEIFKTKRPAIGMIHFLPLAGYKGFIGTDNVLKKALFDLAALEKGGVDGVMVENNYDIPHKIFVEPETVVCMTYLTDQITKRTKLPVGISVLWNDYKASLSIAKVCNGKFVRVPVFVDNVRTNYGEILSSSKDVLAYRRKIRGEHIALFTDIHVKHAVHLTKKGIGESAKNAIRNGSDALIITGKWTADAPDKTELEDVRRTAKDFPILVGSGATYKNLSMLLRYADGVVVGTALKTGKNDKRRVNIRGEFELVSLKKTKEFMKEFRRIIKP